MITVYFANCCILAVFYNLQRLPINKLTNVELERVKRLTKLDLQHPGPSTGFGFILSMLSPTSFCS